MASEYEYAPTPHKVIGKMIAVSPERLHELESAERKLAAVRNILHWILRAELKIEAITKALETP